MSKFFDFVDKQIGEASNKASLVSAILLVGMILLVTVAVVARYVFDTPIVGANEALTIIPVGLVFVALAEVERKNRHIRVTIFSSQFPPRVRLFIDLCGDILAIGVFIIITWQLIKYSLALRAAGSASLILAVPEYLIVFVAAFGTALAILAFSSTLAHRIRELVERGRSLLWLIPVCAIALLMLTAPLLLEMLPWQLGKSQAAAIGIPLMILLLLLGLRIGIVMLLIGYIGTSYTSNLNAGFSIMALVPYSNARMYSWIVLPLFIAMGNFVAESRFARDIYVTFHKWLGRLPGGLAMATVGGCAGFAAACGSSLATAVTIGKIGLPEMKRYKYDDKLATGCIAAGGTLGILIPPSVGFIVYGIITEVSIGKLFIAGILPGIMLASMFMLLIYFRVRAQPSLAVLAPGTSLKEKLISLKGTFGILSLFLLVIGGIYIGLVTPSEGGGLGAFGALFIGLIMGRWTWQRFSKGTRDAAELNAALYFIILGAFVFGHFVSASGVPIAISEFLTSLPLGRWGIFALVLLLYVIVGCIMNIMPAMLITLPMIFPSIVALGFDPIWFGVVMVITMEMGQITPPIGIVVFAIAGIAEDVPMASIFKGIFPFLLVMLLSIGILSIFPQIATFLPNLLK